MDEGYDDGQKVPNGAIPKGFHAIIMSMFLHYNDKNHHHHI